MLGGGVIAYAFAGMFMSDQLEQVLGYVPTEDDKKRLKEAIPKVMIMDKDK